MSKLIWTNSLLLAGALFLTGCGKKENTGSQPEVKGPPIDGTKYVLKEEPAGARGVIEVRKQAKDGEEVVIVGRIGGSKNPWVKDKAAFWIVDASFKPCNEKDDDDCKTPWDYCCDDPKELRAGTATIKFVDEQGETLKADARGLLGLKELHTVVIRGQAKRDEQGNLTVLASGLFRRPDAKK
jgi:hypothetical protein